MAKSSTMYVCQQCGYDTPKWAGKCPNCGEWNTMVEMRGVSESKSGGRKSSKIAKKSFTLKDVPKTKTKRKSTNISEFDRVLGGGLVDGQVVLLAGEPGIGKSTLLLQLAQKFKDVYYVSGEESATQIKLRADRLKVNSKTLRLLDSTDVDVVLATLEKDLVKESFSVVIIDSVQTMSTSDLSGIAGSVGQVRECGMRLISFAKTNGIPLVMVGHVTKEGTVAGPATLTHMVDTVLWFEGDKLQSVRLIRALKNRFGATDEVGVFEMKESGLEGISDAESFFLDSEKTGPGSAVTAILEGTRPVLIEIQSLVIPSNLAIPRRVVQGLDSKRVELIIAILSKHCGLNLGSRDVYVNVVGGIKVNDPAVDLAIAASIMSSEKDKPIVPKRIVVGELDLQGRIREVSQFKKRLVQAKRLGYTKYASGANYKGVCEALKSSLAK